MLGPQTKRSFLCSVELVDLGDDDVLNGLLGTTDRPEVGDVLLEVRALNEPPCEARRYFRPPGRNVEGIIRKEFTKKAVFQRIGD